MIKSINEWNKQIKINKITHMYIKYEIIMAYDILYGTNIIQK